MSVRKMLKGKRRLRCKKNFALRNQSAGSRKPCAFFMHGFSFQVTARFLVGNEFEKHLIERIRRQGRLSFCEFMQAALYDAEFGYYNSQRQQIGATGDYYTSGNVHAAFGAILAKALVELSNAFTGAAPLALVEMGAGTGQLAFDVLSALRDEHPQIFQRARYTIVEQSPVMRARQKEKLQPFAGHTDWRALEELQAINGIVFSNELVDALPVHRLRFSRQGIEEQFVAIEAAGDEKERLALVWSPLSDQRLAEYVRRTAVDFLEGQVIEVSLAALDWLKKMSQVIERGLLLTIDYGDLAAHLYSPDRGQGTLRCFYRHRLSDAPLERLGEQDITASVNFSALIDFGAEFGFEKVSYERQTNFLFRHGLIERIAAMENQGTMDDLQDRLAVKNLLAPGGVSDNFRVLIQRKISNPEALR
jgi:SAM-dependent MidA family methyltransferase